MKIKIIADLRKETERYIAQEILYDDVYVGPFTEQDGVNCAVHAVHWFCKNLWHDIREEPTIGRLLIVEFCGEPQHGYAIKRAGYFDKTKWHYTRWCYLTDILPDEKI